MFDQVELSEADIAHVLRVAYLMHTYEVPLIEPHEILVPAAPSTSSSCDSSKLLEELQLPDFEWPSDCNTSSDDNNNNKMSLWDDDDFNNTWGDLLSDRSELALDDSLSSPLIQCPTRMPFDQEYSWAYI
ncbi:hypothetical protein GOBAR_DD00934 [Gossypium barbadense]|nr:hypothetical protein GOBAR_DD00934 [Gossypium barbadense]